MKKILTIILAILMVFSFINAMAEDISLDDREVRDYIKPTKASPMDTAFTQVSLAQAEGTKAEPPSKINLDGAWDMVEGATDTYEKINVADAGVSVSSTFGPFAKGRLVDGILTSTNDNMWVSDGAIDPKPTITFDLGSIQDVRRVIIYSGGVEAGHYARDYEVLGSVDNDSWTTLDQRMGNQERVVQHEISGSYRYIRIHITTPCLFDVYSRIYEIEVYRVANLKKVTGLSVINSSGFLSPFDVNNLVDGAWSNEASDEWVSTGDDFTSYAVVDAGRQIDASKFIIRHNAGAITTDFRIDGSNNNEDWTTVSTVTGNTQATSELVPTSPALYKYLRLYITKPNNLPDKYARVFEFEIYEKQSVDWNNSIVAQVPGSVHTALYQNGLIPDPYVAKNDSYAREESYKPWWFKKTFTFTGDTAGEVLSFGGICESGTIWLNGQFLGAYKGMFTAIEFDVSDILVQGTNEIIVKNNSAPYRIYSAATGELTGFFEGMNIGWADTVVFNNSYGWHYANMPAVGIWRSVKLEKRAPVLLDSPFIAAADANAGLMDFYTDITGNSGIDGNLIVTVKPENFEGLTYTASYPVNTTDTSKSVHLRFNIPNPQLWWPNGMGEQNLYTLETSFVPTSGAGDYKESIFGIRTIEMQPAAGIGLNENYYNWTFVINGQPMFLKGSNWCTIDAMMRFDYSRYDHFLTLGKNQGLQLLRAWGSGMVETDEFYDLCNRYGICVYQEWPTAWDSYKTQPTNALYDTVLYSTKRLRNNPSLIMWGGGNEGGAPLDNPVLNTMARMTIENDGTRPWHRQDAYGGSLHDYSCYWGNSPLDYNVSTLPGAYSSVFIGEFGIASLPNIETVNKYLPVEERGVWPPVSGGSLEYHTPVFNTKACMTNLSKYTGDFINVDSVEDFVIGTQLAQSVGTRHALEKARASWPNITGSCYYKLTDVYPSASWATVDNYGVPKLAYYTIQDSYAPLTSVMPLTQLNFYEQELNLPVYLLDDNNALEDKAWQVNVRAFDGSLNLIKETNFTGSGSQGKVKNMGNLILTKEQTKTVPLFVVLDTKVEGERVARNYYYLNYTTKQGSLFDLPKTKFNYTAENGKITITNIGEKPGVSVSFEAPSVSDTFIPDDNFIWLDVNESVTIKANSTQGVTGVTSWNGAVNDDTAPSAPTAVSGAQEQSGKVSVSWNEATDEQSGISLYNIYRNGELISTTKATSFVDENAVENTTYSYQISAVNGGLVEGAKSAAAVITTVKDEFSPYIVSSSADANSVKINFSEKVQDLGVNSYKIYGVAVLNREISPDGKTVTLTTSLLDQESNYTIYIVGVSDISEAKNMLTDKKISITPSLQGFWKLNGDAKDYSGKGYNGIYNGVTNSEGTEGLSAYFDGSETTYIDIPNFDAPITNKFTIVAHVKLENKSDYQVIVAKDTKTANHFELYVTPQGNLCFYAPAMGDFASNVLVADGKWHQVAVAYNGEKLVFSVDGYERSIYTAKGSISIASKRLSIGRLAEKEGNVLFPAKGSIDYVAIYSSFLNFDDIKLHNKKLVNSIALGSASLPSGISAEGGSYDVNIKLDTNVVKESKCIIGVYSGDKLINSYIQDVENGITKSINVPANSGNIIVKAFLWDGLSEMTPILEPIAQSVERSTVKDLADVAYVKHDPAKPVTGIVVEFHGLNGGATISGFDENDTELVNNGAVVIYPYYGPWSWMNKTAINLVDEIVEKVYQQYDPSKTAPLIIRGLSMGGHAALTYTRFSKHHVNACEANCPVADIEYHFNERVDLPPTFMHAFGPNYQEIMPLFNPVKFAQGMPDIPYLIIHNVGDTQVHKANHSDVLVPKMRMYNKTVTYIEGGAELGHCQLTAAMSRSYQDFAISFLLK